MAMNVRPCGFLVAACFCAALFISCGKADRSQSGGKAVATAQSCRIIHPQMRPMARVLSVTGTLAAHDQSVLSAKVSGRLKEVNVDVGSVVRAGDVLAQIEPRDYELAVQQAEAALAQARVSLGLVAEGEL